MIVLALVGLPPEAPARGDAGSHAASGAAGALSAKGKKKRKAKRCKGGRVPVKVNKRRRCRPLSAAIPAPADADRRLLAAQAALGFEPGKIRDRRHRRAVPASRLAAKLSPTALATTGAAIAQGLGELDGLISSGGGSQSGAAGASPLAAAASACGASGPSQSSSFAGSGFSGTATLSEAGAELGIGLEGNGLRIEADLSLCDPDDRRNFVVQECPTAEGRLDGNARSRMRVGLRIYRGAELLMARSFNLTAETKIKAQVGDDAKLDYFEIEHIYTLRAALGGSRQQFGPMAMTINYNGKTRVNMRNGSYDASNTSVGVTIRVAGVDEVDVIAAEASIERKLKREAEADFAAAIRKAMDKLRAREQAWLVPNFCASVKFAPPSQALKLTKGRTGVVNATIESKRGGAPPTAKWTRTAQQNATFPATANANPAPLSYSVTDAGDGIQVSGSFRAASRAGVAEATWTQDTATAINAISGNFSGSFNMDTILGPSSSTIDGNVEFERSTPSIYGGADGVYAVKAADYTVSLAGIDSSGATGCYQQGSKQFTVPPGLGSGSIWVTGTLPDLEPPYDYSFSITHFEPMTGTRYNCPQGAEAFEGTSFQTGIYALPATQQNHVSSDGTAYNGSEDQTEGGNGFSFSWAFVGEE